MEAKQFIFHDDLSVTELAQQDPTLKKLIDRVGDIEKESRPDFYKSLIRSIIGQQISVKAAESVFNKLNLRVDYQLTADTVALLTPEDLKEAGLSAPKIKYIQDLTHLVTTGKLDLHGLKELDNESVTAQLTRVKGIGKWTAEMFLIFSLGRMNVLPIDDIGLQRGAQWLYQVDKSERRQILVKNESLWHPHLTLASFYLWEAVHLGLITMYQSIDEAIEHHTIHNKNYD